VNDVPHAGSTDKAIIRDMCIRGGVPDALIWERMDVAMADAAVRIVRYVDTDLSHLVLPGVRRAMDALRRCGAVVALTTGNLEACAWEKMKAAGLREYFNTGAFGSDCLLRTDILKTAISRALELEDVAFKARAGDGRPYANVFHIGDAVTDMQAAREAGANGIGVLTGAFDRKQLEAEAPLAVLDDLSDTSKFLALLGINDV